MADVDRTDSRFFFERAMNEAELVPFTHGEVAVFCAPSPLKGNAPNEDSAAVVPVGPNAGVLALADGVGGLPGGERASCRALSVLEESLRKGSPEPRALRDAVLDGLDNANRAVQAEGSGATTVATVAVHAGTVRSYHAGDSLILIVGQRGRIKFQSVSHSPVGYAVESGLLDEREALLHEDRHLLSNMVGSPEMRIEIGPELELDARDTILLSSDGLSDNLHIDEIVEIVRKGPLIEAAQELADICRKRMMAERGNHPSKPDDLSLLAFRANG